ncbi:MAG TPA: pyruvate kinase [Armatimonadota bacterium]
MRRTKIICTIGPATRAPERLRALIDAGMNVARLNFSHGEFAEHAQTIRDIRAQAETTQGPIAILLDLPGPKIRIGEIQGGTVWLERGQEFVLTSRMVSGSADEASLPNQEVRKAVKPGDSVFLDDGSIHLKVLSTNDTDIRTRVLVGGNLSSHKGVAVPGVRLDIATITQRDLDALAFGVEHGVDWFAASFVRSAADLNTLRAHQTALGASIPIIAKIEKHEAVSDIDAIIDAADAVMVARGDLGVDVDIWRVPTIQKDIIRRCNCVGKPVITATQMLESMTYNPRPTRAEVTDVANAILDGTDCVMLSGETAIGKYPTETVAMMVEIARNVETTLDFGGILKTRMEDQAHTVTDSISAATVVVAGHLNAAAILTATSSGSTARMISRYRPKSPIIGVTTQPETYRRLALSWGVNPVLAPMADSIEGTLDASFNSARDAGLVSPGDIVVLTGGLPVGVPGNTNLIRVATVEEAGG